jgi:four helix bundle protein
MSDFRTLLAYQKAFILAMEIFKISNGFPKEERYSLTDQIRRSSRSVCACIGEAYRKRRYQAHFISKLTDSDMENTETQV